MPPVWSAARAASPDVGLHHRRARPGPAPGATRGGVGGFPGQVRGCGGGGGVARRGPPVGLAVRGSRPPGLRAAACPAPSRPTCAYAVVRRTRRSGGVVRGTAVRAGWGPPATRCRLCVLRQIGDQLVAGLEQFLLVDDVVAVEDGAGLVAGQEHGDALGDAGADQVAGGGAAAIMEEAGRHAGRLTGRAPGRAPAADRDAVAVEDQRAVGVAARPSPRQGPRQWVAKWGESAPPTSSSGPARAG